MSLNCDIDFTLNGRPVSTRVPVQMNALTMLRDVLGFTGTKRGCGEGQCSACTILVDGHAVNACLLFAVNCDGHALTTIEGLPIAGGLTDLQQAFVDHWSIQCGFCTPGMLMEATYLLSRNPGITEDEIKYGLEGNFCRCTGYRKIIDAVAHVAAKRAHAS